MKIRASLKKTRENNNLTQIEVAKFLNIAETSYQRIEAGTRGTSEINWIKLFNLFNKKIPLNELMENSKEELIQRTRKNSSKNQSTK